jgi:hypothetical protein
MVQSAYSRSGISHGRRVGIRRCSCLAYPRNLRKLHRGTHDGIRFIIRLRDCAVSKEAVVERCDLPSENESTTELRIWLEFGFNKGETQWDKNVIQLSRSFGNY